MKISIYILLLFLGLLQAPLSQASTWLEQGERLTYQINWSFISVGQAELLLQPQGERYSITGRAWTGNRVNTVYNLLDRIQIQGALSQDNLFLTTEYTAKLNENDYRAYKNVHYDRSVDKVQYTNIHAGHKPVVSTLLKNSRDMISALYYLRAHQQNLQTGDIYTLPIFELDKPYTLKIYVKSRQKMDTVLGKVDVFEIQPVLLNSQGVSKKKKNKLSLWVTADGEFIPVKIEINLSFGSFRAMLTKVDKANSPSEAPDYLPEVGKIDIQGKKRLNYDNFTND